MDKKCRIGLIGLGFIGGLHARCIAEGANTELVAVADLNNQYGWPRSNGCFQS